MILLKARQYMRVMPRARHLRLGDAHEQQLQCTPRTPRVPVPNVWEAAGCRALQHALRRVACDEEQRVQVPEAVSGDVSNKAQLQVALNAALICGLEQVNPFTKIVLMDRRGRSTKRLARAVTAQGYRGYTMRGGYLGWRSAGLATSMEGTYDVTAGELLPTALLLAMTGFDHRSLALESACARCPAS